MKYFKGNRVYIAPELYYTIRKIKNRIVFSPCEELKKAQRYFKQAIEWTYPLKMSTLAAAKVHTGKKWVLKMDIKDFYNSVQVEYIAQVIKNSCKRIKNSNVYYYAMISTLDEKIPTGAATSAHIANACFSPVEKRIKAYCTAFGIDYSRYMDDLTFSADDKFFLNKVEKYVTEILPNFGYKINGKKTKYISDNKQQKVLGLVVNSNSVRLPKELRRKLRAMIHSYTIFKNSATEEIPLKYRAWDEKRILRLKGYLAYAKQADEKSYEQLMRYKKFLNLKLQKP